MHEAGHDGGSTRGTHLGVFFTIAQAAEACGVSRDTIKRRRAAGAFPNAVLEGGAWAVPLADLLAAGLQPGRPAQPDAPADGGGDGETTVIDLREQIADLRGRLAERDRAEARSAELVEQLQAALRGQMRAIEAGRADADGRIAALEQARADAAAGLEQARAAADSQARAAETAQRALDRAMAEQAAARRWAGALLLLLMVVVALAAAGVALAVR